MGAGEHVRHPFKLCGPGSESESNSNRKDKNNRRGSSLNSRCQRSNNLLSNNDNNSRRSDPETNSRGRRPSRKRSRLNSKCSSNNVGNNSNNDNSPAGIRNSSNLRAARFKAQFARMTEIHNIANKCGPTSPKTARDHGIPNTAIGANAGAIAVIEYPTIASEFISGAVIISGWADCN